MDIQSQISSQLAQNINLDKVQPTFSADCLENPIILDQAFGNHDNDLSMNLHLSMEISRNNSDQIGEEAQQIVFSGKGKKGSQKKASISKKNTNVPKKLGRIVNKYKEEYRMKNGRLNEGIRNMYEVLQQQALTRNQTNIKKKYKEMDVFNKEHIKVLFNKCNAKTTSSNLKNTQRILNKHLRKEVFQTPQKMSRQNYLMYINTLKVSSLRMCNKNLAHRFEGLGSIMAKEKKKIFEDDHVSVQSRFQKLNIQEEEEQNGTLLYDYNQITKKNSRK